MHLQRGLCIFSIIAAFVCAVPLVHAQSAADLLPTEPYAGNTATTTGATTSEATETAGSTPDMAAKISALRVQVMSLLQQIAAVTGSSSTEVNAPNQSSVNLTHSLTIGDSGSDVSALQRFLKSLGYFSYPEITGYFGQATKDAVIAYQTANAISPASGFVGSLTRAALAGSTSTSAGQGTQTENNLTLSRSLTIGDSGSDVSALQTFLKALGFFTYPDITGYFGQVTKDAVIAYQKAHNISPTSGFVGTLTRAVLAVSSASVGGNGTTSGNTGTGIPNQLQPIPFIGAGGGGGRSSSSSSGGGGGSSSGGGSGGSTHSINYAGTVYYVSPTGNDTNSGTSESTPWQTINKVNGSNFSGGDAVLFEGGQTFTGCLEVQSSHLSGTSSTSPFTIGAYGTGNYEIDANCFGEKPNQAAAVELFNASGLVLQDGTLRGNSGGAQFGVWIQNNNSTTMDGVTVQRMDIGGFYTASTTDFGAEIFLTGSPHGIKDVNILDNTLHGLSGPTSPDEGGVYGFGINENIKNVLYDGNTIYDIGGKAHSTVGGAEGIGIVANGVNGGTIQHNVAHDIGANTTTCGGPGALWAYHSNDITIQFNEVYNVRPINYTTGCDWIAYDLDGGVTNSVIQYNYSHDNYGSGYLLYADTSSSAGGAWGPNTVRYNISENDDQKGIANYGGIRFSGYYGQTTTAVANIYNNTIWSDVDGATAFTTENRNPSSGIVANNIFAIASSSSTGQAYFMYTSNLTPKQFTFKNNDWFPIDGGTPRWNYGGTDYTSLAAWQATSTGADANASMADPQFVSAGTTGTCGGWATSCGAGYKLQDSSPLLGTGLDLYQSPYLLAIGTHDYFDAAIPNIGNGSGYNFGASGAPASSTGTDTTAPSVSVTSPASGDTAYGSATFTASASDNTRVVGVTFYVDGIKAGAELTAEPYTMTWATGGVTRGSHNVVAVARDAAGNDATSTAVSFTTAAATYYVSTSGSDNNNGRSPSTSWQTLAKVNKTNFGPGDTIEFNGGDTFSGCLSFTGGNVHGTSTSSPFTISSYGTGNYTIDATCGHGNSAINLQDTSGVILENGTLIGNTNTNNPAQYGVWVHTSSGHAISDITIRDMDISGFYSTSTSEWGSEVYVTGAPGNGINNLYVGHNTLHGNDGATSPDDAGISGYGNGKNITNATYEYNEVYDIGGKANGISGSDGNGILANGVDGGVLQHNLVHEIGANENTCGGPGGIWAYNSNNITIQFNEVYHVRPYPSYPGRGCDWIAYDLDGYVTNSVVQYNYSHDNFGEPFLAYTYDGGSSTGWGNDTFRYNVSENDAEGNSNSSLGLLYIAGGGVHDAASEPLYVYNNTIWEATSTYAYSVAVVAGKAPSGVIANNIFGTGAYHYGIDDFFYSSGVVLPDSLLLLNNDYYAIGQSGTPHWQISGHLSTSLSDWQATIAGGEVNATTTNPLLFNPGSTGICGGFSTDCLRGYRLQNASPVYGALDLNSSPYALSVGSQDLFGNAIPNSDVYTGFNDGAYGAAIATSSDLTPPSTNLTAPNSGAVVGGVVTLTATASDNIGVTGIQFSIDGQNIGSSGSASPYSYSWNSTSASNSSHTIAVAARDAAGNYATSSETVTVSNSAPVISAVATSSVTTSGATVTWTTNVPATTQVEYGTTDSYGTLSTYGSSLVTSHSVALTGLTKGTMYHFAVMSANTTGATTTSSDGIFATASYLGPGDVYSGALAWWGLRAYDMAYAGNIANVCDSTTCADVSTINGTMTIPNSISDCTTTTCTVRTLYDQSGALKCNGNACDLTQNATSSRPLLVPNCLGSGLFCLNITSKVMSNAIGFTQTYPYSYVFNAERNNAGGQSQIFAGGNATTTYATYGGSAKQIATMGGCLINNVATDFVWHTFWTYAGGGGGSSGIGVDTTGAGCNGTKDSLIGPFTLSTTTENIPTDLTEFGIWGGKLAGTVRSNFNSNSHAYWGF